MYLVDLTSSDEVLRVDVTLGMLPNIYPAAPALANIGNVPTGVPNWQQEFQLWYKFLYLSVLWGITYKQTTFSQQTSKKYLYYHRTEQSTTVEWWHDSKFPAKSRKQNN